MPALAAQLRPAASHAVALRELLSCGSASTRSLARACGLDHNRLHRLLDSECEAEAADLAKIETYLAARANGTALAMPEEIINEARNGRMFILTDDEDRENEGDLVVPAQMATPDAINFMATHGRGLICLALTRARVEQLGLNPMSQSNGTRHETAFTVSIEAREGVTTGISAADRARTISTAIDSVRTAADIVTPGHVFPLMAQDGGVLVRTGHTEAAVDVARLAGLNPSGVICEIMNNDGSMARLDDLMPFARRHGLKIGTIRDLIAYRLQHDHLIEKRSEIAFTSEWGGTWRAMTFFNAAMGTEQLALQLGDIVPTKPTLVRMHQSDPLADLFAAEGPRRGLLQRSMELIRSEGAGVIVCLNKRIPDALTRLFSLGMSGANASHDMESLRDYGLGAQILVELGVQEMVLLTNSHRTLVALQGYGLSIVEERPIPLR